MVQEYGFDNDDDDEDAQFEMEIPRANSEILSLIVDFMKHHVEDPMNKIPIPLGAESFDGVRASVERASSFGGSNLSPCERILKAFVSTLISDHSPVSDLVCPYYFCRW